MKRRRYHLPPPVNAEYRSGVVIELSAADDTLNAGKPIPPTVELTPAGPAPLVIDFTPEDDKVRVGDTKPDPKKHASGSPATRRAAFLAELDRCGTSAGDPARQIEWVSNPGQWADVLPDSEVWSGLTGFLIRTDAVVVPDVVNRFLQYGGVPLANYWLTTQDAALRNETIRWLSDNWRAEWERLTDQGKRALMEHFADALRQFASALQKRGDEVAPLR